MRSMLQIESQIYSHSWPRIKVLTETHGKTPCANDLYPVVVCSSFDRIYAVDFNADSDPEPIHENFQLEVRYAYVDRHESQRNDYFLLDFVAFDKLAEFEKAIDAGASAAAFLASD